MTKDEFERQYAERSGTTVDFLRSIGRLAEPCNCGEDECQGWQMAHREEWHLTNNWESKEDD